jgi:dolichol-phosphate mannosyltransferase
MISIIIPTYNESENIVFLVSKINKVMKTYSYEIVVVDDNSPDKTYEIAKKLEKVMAINRKNKKGLASAVVDGFRIAKGDVLVVMDADLSHDPRYLPIILGKLKKYDLSIGSRFIKKSSFRRDIISIVAGLLALPFTKVKDPMSGFFALKKKVIRNIKFRPRGYKILLEILVKGDYGLIYEERIVFKERKYGESKLSFSIMFQYIFQVIELFIYKL